MQPIERFLHNDRFARRVGVELIEVAPGRAKARLAIEPDHMNGAGILHGAAIFSLADFAFAAASNSHGTIAVAINVSISFLKAVREGTLTAEATEVAINPKLGNYTVRVLDESGELVAIFQGMVYRKKDPITA
ncbi:MAG: PaaI family thioesterase [Kiritimatiellia bacterium]